MEIGSIAKWIKKEGDRALSGEAIADIQTDKATVVFEAIDEVYIAKILVKEGVDVSVGTPIMITVDEESHVKSFADFSLESKIPEIPKEIASQKPPEPINPPTTSKSVSAETTISAGAGTIKSTPAPVSKPSTGPSLVDSAPKVEPPKIPTVTAKKPELTPAVVRVLKSGLYSKLAADQQEYLKKYGYSGHKPLPAST